jgi:hypothetical protein
MLKFAAIARTPAFQKPEGTSLHLVFPLSIIACAPVDVICVT